MQGLSTRRSTMSSHAGSALSAEVKRRIRRRSVLNAMPPPKGDGRLCASPSRASDDAIHSCSHGLSTTSGDALGRLCDDRNATTIEHSFSCTVVRVQQKLRRLCSDNEEADMTT